MKIMLTDVQIAYYDIFIHKLILLNISKIKIPYKI